MKVSNTQAYVLLVFTTNILFPFENIANEMTSVTVHRLSPLLGFELRPGNFDKVASDLGLDDGFRRALLCPTPLTTV